MTTDCLDRARGALVGLAIGNALGTPMRGLSRSLIHELYGLPLAGFEEPSHDHEVEAGGMVTGAVGRPVLHALALADHLIDNQGHIDSNRWALELAAGGRASARKRGNSAAVRAIPLGIARRAEPLDELVELTAASCAPTHDSHVAISAAAAVVAAVATAIDGAGLAAAIGAGVRAARLGPQFGHYVAAPDLAQRLDWALACVDPAAPEVSIALVCDLIGTANAAQESVPAAFAVLATLPDREPWETVRWAASLGGSADGIAAIVGAVAGACHGLGGWNPDAVIALEQANPELGLQAMADKLHVLRG